MGAAYLLNTRHDVTVYEKEPRMGGHSRTLEVQAPEGVVAVDTGFIVFNRRNYPELSALFASLGVPVAKSRMSFGVSVNDGWLEYSTRGLAGLFAQKANLLRPEFHRMLADITRFNRRAMAYAERNPDASMEQCLSELGLGEWFRRYYLLAMGASIWSTPPRQMLGFPARVMIQFFANHGLLTISGQPQWYTVQGGSREYISRVTSSFRDRLRLGCPALEVRRQQSGLVVTDASGDASLYDQVVFACHSDQALRLIAAPSEAHRQALGSIRYHPNRAVLHGDRSFMPRRRQAWSSWSYLCAGEGRQEDGISLSYWMNNLQPLGTDQPIIVTMNPGRQPRPELVHDEHVFEHPLFDSAAIAAQRRLPEIQGEGGMWFCGAWCRYGFHEDGLGSAVAVAEKLGARAPWRG